MQFVGSRYSMGTPNLKELNASLSQRLNLSWQPSQITWAAMVYPDLLFLHQSVEGTISLPF